MKCESYLYVQQPVRITLFSVYLGFSKHLIFFIIHQSVKDNLLTQVLGSPGDYEDIQDRLCPQEACDIFEDT